MRRRSVAFANRRSEREQGSEGGRERARARARERESERATERASERERKREKESALICTAERARARDLSLALLLCVTTLFPNFVLPPPPGH